MRSTIRTATLGALLVGGAIALAACGSTPAAAPAAPATPKTSTAAPATPVAVRKYTVDWIQTQLTTTKNQDGTSTLTAGPVDANGTEKFSCNVTWKTGINGTLLVAVTSAGAVSFPSS
jgi:hypothetical protein